MVFVKTLTAFQVEVVLHEFGKHWKGLMRHKIPAHILRLGAFDIKFFSLQCPRILDRVSFLMKDTVTEREVVECPVFETVVSESVKLQNTVIIVYIVY